jgi:hypothetical protein
VTREESKEEYQKRSNSYVVFTTNLITLQKRFVGEIENSYGICGGRKGGTGIKVPFSFGNTFTFLE